MMKQKMNRYVLLVLTLLAIQAGAQKAAVRKPAAILPGAFQTDRYLPLIRDKAVAIFANQTSTIGQSHLVDSLKKRGVNIKVIFSPEHGFRGNADAGEHVMSSIDSATGIPIISLYGDHRKPNAADLEGVDVMIFDIQDVGLRYYTFISSLQEYMESAIQFQKPVIVLDRPNPNGFYVDGPVLEDGFQSYVGMQKIPVVYGLTIGEYARFLLGERLFNKETNERLKADSIAAATASKGKKVAKVKAPAFATNTFSLTVIPCKNYTHDSYYELPIKPSPNLPNMQSVLLYSSICYFEGTDVSLGRGTDKPFQIYGAPQFPDSLFSFTPVSTPGAKNPPLKDKRCYGYDLSTPPIDIRKKENRRINLSYLMNAYKLFPNKDSFFLRPKKGNPKTSDYFFNKLAGNDKLMWQVMNLKSEAAIRESWKPGIAAFMKVRKKYLLYKDFTTL